MNAVVVLSRDNHTGAKAVLPRRAFVPTREGGSDPFPVTELMVLLLELLVVEETEGDMALDEVEERLAGLEALQPSPREQVQLWTMHGDALRKRLIEATRVLAHRFPEAVMNPSSLPHRTTLKESLLFLELTETRILGVRAAKAKADILASDRFQHLARTLIEEFEDSPRVLTVLEEIGVALEPLPTHGLPAGSVRLNVRSTDGRRSARVELGTHTGWRLQIEGDELIDLVPARVISIDA